MVKIIDTLHVDVSLNITLKINMVAHFCGTDNKNQC